MSDLMPFAGTKICQSCYQSHLRALTAISTGAMPTECSECGKSTSWLREIGALGDNGMTMIVHNENGAYRFMCKPCDRVYVRKRSELYGPTEFGHRIGLK